MTNPIYDVLKNLGISYTEHTHPAVFTTAEAEPFYRDSQVWKSKNLFLRNRKGDQHYLVVVDAATRVDLKQLAQTVNEKQLSFASPERLLKYLHVTPGSVSPLALMNDSEHHVKVLIDQAMQAYEKVYHHPNINTATLEMTRADFEKFLAATGHSFRWLTF